jgi:hypothetical protein
MRNILFAALAAIPVTAAVPQVTSPGPTGYPGSVTLYEYPAYLGRSVTVTSATPDLAARGFVGRAQSARVVGDWQVCPQASYQGACQTLSASSRLLSRPAIVSLRPLADAQAAANGTSNSSSNSTSGSNSNSNSSSNSNSNSNSSSSSSSGSAVDLDSLDADAGTEGQDVGFFARPSLGGSQVSAGANDRAAGDAFCIRAGYASSAYASRARVAASNLIDLSTRARVRAYPLRDVLCRR